MSFNKEKWRAELKKIEHAIDDGTGGVFFGTDEDDALALLERAYVEGRADCVAALEEIHIMSAADGSAEFLTQQRRRIGQLAIDALAAARGTP